MPKELRFRSLAVAESQVNEESRTVRFPVASDAPVDVGYGTETLSHDIGAMRNGERQQSMSLLFNHDRDKLLGVVERLDQDEHRTYATVRFAKTDEAQRAFELVKDRILVNVSCGYRVYAFDQSRDGTKFLAKDWEIFEVSLVTVPADTSVGVYRSLSDPNEGEKAMTTSQQPGKNAAAGDPKPADIDVEKVRSAERKAERERIQAIETMCRDFNVPLEQRQKLINEGRSIDEARAMVMETIRGRSANPTGDSSRAHNDFDIGLSETERSRYSLVRALNAALTNDWRQAGFEREVSQELARRMQRDTTGFFMPTNITLGRRDDPTPGYLASPAAQGGNLIATQLLTGSFIEALRARAMVMRLGATLLTGLVGNVEIPRQSGVSTVSWISETGTVTGTNATFDKVPLSMKTVAAKSFISRNMLKQASLDVELFVRNELITSIALGVDLACLTGTGSNGQPKGIFNQTNVGKVGGTTGTDLSFDLLIDMETQVAAANVVGDTMAYMCNARTIGALKKLKDDNGQYLWKSIDKGFANGTPGEVNGYPVARSNQLCSNITVGESPSQKTCSELVFGNWSDIVIGEWGVVELLPNPFSATAYDNGGVEIRALQSLDVAVRHPESFCIFNDAVLA